MNAKVMIAAALLPVLLGALVIWNTFAGPVARRRGAIALALVAACGAAWFLERMTLVAAATLPGTNRVKPLIGVWGMALPALSILCLTAAWRMRSWSVSARAALLALAAISGLLTLYAALEQVAVRIPYLSYQLGTPRLDPWPDTWWIAGLGVVLAGDALLVFRRTSPDSSLAPSRVACLFQLAAAGLAVAYFVLINFVHGHQELVRAIVAVDRDGGGIVWVAEGLRGPQEPIDGRNSPATPTPVTDGERVCAYFGSHGLMCADSVGRVTWSRVDLGYIGYYGVGFSPVLADGLLVIASDMPDGLTRVAALDVRTGDPAWTRVFRGKGSTSGNNRTPLVKRIGGATALILWGIDGVRGLNLETGADLWNVPMAGEVDLVASMISDDEKLYLSDRTGTAAIDLARLARGETPEVWRSKVRSNCVSPVLCRNLLFTVSDEGIASAVHADTGAIAWRRRLNGTYFASLVASRDAVYFTNDEGVTTVAACEDAYHEIARNDLGEPTIASMAAAGERLYVRTASSLFSLRTDP